MKKQFEILEKLYSATKASEERIAVLRKHIEKEFSEIRKSLIDVYPHENETMFLVNFDSYGLTYYKATTKRLHEVKLTWFESNIKIGIPKTYDTAVFLLNKIEKPTNCEISSYITFGYFHDVEKNWDRIDWITEMTMEKKFLFEITEFDFIKAIDLVYNFYVNKKNE